MASHYQCSSIRWRTSGNIDHKRAGVSSAAICEDVEIRHRITESPKGKHTTQCVLHENVKEVGFVAFDDFPELDCLALCELFVPRQLRSEGLGTRIIAEVETLARHEGYGRIQLLPWPLEHGFPEASLIGWYQRNGYLASERAHRPRLLVTARGPPPIYRRPRRSTSP